MHTLHFPSSIVKTFQSHRFVLSKPIVKNIIVLSDKILYNPFPPQKIPVEWKH